MLQWRRTNRLDMSPNEYDNLVHNKTSISKLFNLEFNKFFNSVLEKLTTIWEKNKVRSLYHIIAKISDGFKNLMIKIYIRLLVNTVKSILLIYHLSFPKCCSITNEGWEAGELFLCKPQGQREVAGEVSEEM